MLVHSLGLKLGLDPPSDPEDVEVNLLSMWNMYTQKHKDQSYKIANSNAWIKLMLRYGI